MRRPQPLKSVGNAGKLKVICFVSGVFVHVFSLTVDASQGVLRKFLDVMVGTVIGDLSGAIDLFGKNQAHQLMREDQLG